MEGRKGKLAREQGTSIVTKSSNTPALALSGDVQHQPQLVIEHALPRALIGQATTWIHNNTCTSSSVAAALGFQMIPNSQVSHCGEGATKS
jgi:hypothetical protein